MAVGGRKPLSNVVKLARGTDKRHLNPDEPLVRKGLTEAAPAWFSKAQAEVWRRQITNCPAHMLRSLDEDVLATYCVAVVEHRAAVIRQRRNPSGVITTLNGNTIQDPNMGIINKQAFMIQKAASELGFSATSRARLKVPQDKDEGESDPYKKYTAKKSA